MKSSCGYTESPPMSLFDKRTTIIEEPQLSSDIHTDISSNNNNESNNNNNQDNKRGPHTNNRSSFYKQHFIQAILVIPHNIFHILYQIMVSTMRIISITVQSTFHSIRQVISIPQHTQRTAAAAAAATAGTSWEFSSFPSSSRKTSTVSKISKVSKQSKRPPSLVQSLRTVSASSSQTLLDDASVDAILPDDVKKPIISSSKSSGPFPFPFEHSTTCSTTTSAPPSSTSSSSSSSSKRLISFITDVEGCGMYFDRFVLNSKVLDFEPVIPSFHNDQNEDYFPYDKRVIFKPLSPRNNDHNDHDDDLEPILVCGGDMWDKGGADLYVTRQLVSLQKRYGLHRVHFILGNRDVNKMRILQELGLDHNDDSSTTDNDDNMNKQRKRIRMITSMIKKKNKDKNSKEASSSSLLPTHGGVYWLRGTGYTGDTELIEKGNDLLSKNNNSNDKNDHHNDTTLPEEYAKAMVPSTSAADRLQWMFKKTMGSPDAFELRRMELKREKKFHIEYQRKQKCNQTTKKERFFNRFRFSNNNQQKQEQEPQQQDEDCKSIQTQKTIHETDIVVTDEEVVQSYKSSTHPVHGVMGQYLRNGKLALRIGKVMFMHGSLPFTPDIVTKYMQYEENNNDVVDVESKKKLWAEVFQDAMPFYKNDDHHNNHNDTQDIQTTSQWIDALNSFAHNQTEAWTLNITSAEQHSSSGRKKTTRTKRNSKFKRGDNIIDNNDSDLTIWSTNGGYEPMEESSSQTFGSLMQYGMGWLPHPGREKNPTVIYETWVTDGMPKKFYSKDELDVAYTRMVRDFFHFSNIDVIVTGHQPVGDVPLPIQVPRTNMNDKSKFIVCADTSYSGDVMWKDGKRKNLGKGNCLSSRGEAAVTEVLIEQLVEDQSVSNLKCHGVLSDGTVYESVNFFDNSRHLNDPQIGQLVDGKKLSCEGMDQQDESDDDLDWWVRSKFENGEYLVSSAKGYSAYNSIAHPKVY